MSALRLAALGGTLARRPLLHEEVVVFAEGAHLLGTILLQGLALLLLVVVWTPGLLPVVISRSFSGQERGTVLGLTARRRREGPER